MLGKYERIQNDPRLSRTSYPSGSSIEVYTSIIRFLEHIPWIHRLNSITRKDKEDYPDIYRFKGFYNLGGDNFKVLEMIGVIKRSVIDITDWKEDVLTKRSEFDDYPNFWNELKDHVELDTEAYFLTNDGKEILNHLNNDIMRNQYLFTSFYQNLNPPYLQLVTFDNELYSKLTMDYEQEKVIKDNIRQLITSNPAGKGTEVNFIMTIIKDLNILTIMQEEPEEKYGINVASLKEYVFWHSIKIINSLIEEGLLIGGLLWSDLKNQLLEGFNLHFIEGSHIINFEKVFEILLEKLEKHQDYEWKSTSRQDYDQMFRGDPTRHVIKINKKFEYKFLMGEETSIFR